MENDSTQVFVSTIDEIDFQTVSLQEYLAKLKDDARRCKIASIKHEADQKRSLLSGLLLQYCFGQWLESRNLTQKSVMQCGQLAYGKPYIEGYEDFHFSISHSGKYVACAVGNNEVGVDIEEYAFKKDVLKIANRFFTEMEYEQLKNLPSKEEQIAYFTRIWTMKESYIKYLGRGLGYGMNSFYAKDMLPNQNVMQKEIHQIQDQKMTEDREQNPYICEYFISPEVCLSVCSLQKTFSDKPIVITPRRL